MHYKLCIFYKLLTLISSRHKKMIAENMNNNPIIASILAQVDIGLVVQYNQIPIANISTPTKIKIILNDDNTINI